MNFPLTFPIAFDGSGLPYVLPFLLGGVNRVTPASRTFHANLVTQGFAASLMPRSFTAAITRELFSAEA